MCIRDRFATHYHELTELEGKLDSVNNYCIAVREDVYKRQQEYFLVDKDTYDKRKDLIFTGRTLFGAPAPKGQELDDHYFGTIKERVLAYMTELNEELWKLGITAKTQHNDCLLYTSVSDRRR